MISLCMFRILLPYPGYHIRQGYHLQSDSSWEIFSNSRSLARLCELGDKIYYRHCAHGKKVEGIWQKST